MRARIQIARDIGGNVLGVWGMEFSLEFEIAEAYLYIRDRGTDYWGKYRGSSVMA